MPARAAASRFACFLAVWLAADGATLSGLALGVVAAGLACRASLALLPPGQFRPQALPLLGLVLSYPVRALVAGFAVACRAFDLRLDPGVVAFRPLLPAGMVRDALLTWSSLMPGTLPVPHEGGDVVAVHALDRAQPVADDMAREEARVARALLG
ncbi:Na+/H+ antiporter subunit E [Roseococcus sp. YIM B11640]|uniref:Na+/H+ antiporter subunit E n=1 Tax=Roseococcus sp. YIM B11640 TaxID=3133973 RepID=UPI003C7DF695